MGRLLQYFWHAASNEMLLISRWIKGAVSFLLRIASDSLHV